MILMLIFDSRRTWAILELFYAKITMPYNFQKITIWIIRVRTYSLSYRFDKY